MSQICELTGKKPLSGNKVSHSNHKTNMRQLPNLKTKRYIVEGLKTTVSVKLSTRAIRTVDKHGGLAKTLFQISERHLSPKLLKLKNRLASR